MRQRAKLREAWRLCDVDSIGVLRLFSDRGVWGPMPCCCAGREIIRSEIRELLDRAWPIADGEQSGNHADEAGVIR
jgi:hypothetical protein